MQSGRKPKPTAVKALEGNPGKRSLNMGEPKPEKKAPRCPASIRRWKRPLKKRARQVCRAMLRRMER